MEKLVSALDELNSEWYGQSSLWTRPELTRRYLAELGGSVTMAVVRVVLVVGRTKETVCVGDVARILSLDASTASRTVGRAVQQGYVIRSGSDSDQRLVPLTLSPAGQSLLRRATELSQARKAKALADWTEEEVATLARLLTRLRKTIDRMEEEVSQPQGASEVTDGHLSLGHETTNSH